MLIFLYGPDSYRLKRKIKELVDYYGRVHKNGLDLRRVDLKETEAVDFSQELYQNLLFEEKKLTVFCNLFYCGKDVKEQLSRSAKYLMSSGGIFVFTHEGTPDPKEPLFNVFKKYGKCQEFKLLKGEELTSWIRKEFEAHKTEIEAKAAVLLAKILGNDTWSLANEINKLSAFTNGRKLSPEDVMLLCRSRKGNAIFDTIDALAQRNKKRSIELIRGHLQSGDGAPYVLAMIAFQMRNIIILKDLGPLSSDRYEVSRATGMHPYVAYKTLTQMRHFTLSELKKIYRRIFEADYELKTGRISPEAALDLLAFGL